MQEPLNIVIVGLGNIGRKVFSLTCGSQEFNLVGVVTRNFERARHDLGSDIRIYGEDDESWINLVDVAILCGGSKDDLPVQGPYYASLVNTVDSFDTHAHVGGYIDPKTRASTLGYYRTMDLIAKATGHTAGVCFGWDPGWFSLMRGLFLATLGEGVRVYAFYGLTPLGGYSMGHTNAAKGVLGVADAIQLTHAIPEAIERVRAGENPTFEPGDMHWREVLVALEPEADAERVRHEIVSMPDYYEPYRTTVEFVSAEELAQRVPGMPHDGLVIARSYIGMMEFKVEWPSNPLVTANILLSSARAVVRMNREGCFGAFTALHTPVDYLLSAGTDVIKLV